MMFSQKALDSLCAVLEYKNLAGPTRHGDLEPMYPVNFGDESRSSDMVAEIVDPPTEGIVEWEDISIVDSEVKGISNDCVSSKMTTAELEDYL